MEPKNWWFVDVSPFPRGYFESLGCHGVSTPTVFKFSGVSLGGSGVSIGRVRILRVSLYLTCHFRNDE